MNANKIEPGTTLVPPILSRSAIRTTGPYPSCSNVGRRSGQCQPRHTRQRPYWEAGCWGRKAGARAVSDGSPKEFPGGVSTYIADR